jgi:hypothetical protein
MLTIHRSKSWVAILLTAILLILCALPVSAAEEAVPLEIRVKVGSDQMKIDGVALKIQPPYQTSGTTMVPLSVFTNTKGFGAKLQLKDNKIITLTYQKHIIILTQGSKSASIDGKKVTLTVAPVVKQGVTMVPLKILVNAFGAQLSSDATTKELIIRGTVASSGSSEDKGTSIDPDSGKSQIGDSYYKWSMNYPTGLVQDYQSEKGDWISFKDVKGDYYLAVSVEEAEEPLDTDDKRDLLSGYSDEDETLVDTKTIKHPAGIFEQMIMKSTDGFFYEYRGIQSNGYFYIFIFGKKAKAASELSANSALVDSFKPSYNAASQAIKDLARIKNGKITFENEDYGLKLQLPKDWTSDKRSAGPYYSGPDDSYLLLTVDSISEGDTLDNWVKRRLQMLSDFKTNIYYTKPEISTIMWNGIPARLVTYSHSYDTVNWWDEYEVYAFNGAHKYYVDFAYLQEDKDDVKTVVDQLLHGMKIDFAHVEKSFGQIPDLYDVDMTATVTKTNKTYGYRLTLPKYWTKGVTDLESDELDFNGFGVGLVVTIDEESSFTEIQEYLEEAYKSMGTLQVDSKLNVTYAGVKAIKYLISSTKKSSNQGHATIYILEKNKMVYMVVGELDDTFASELNRKQLENALNSFQFTN